MNDNPDWIENDCIRHGKSLNTLYTSRMDTENYELARSVTNERNRQYGYNKVLSEDIIGALIHRIRLDNVCNAATKVNRRMAKANAKQASPFDNEDVSLALPGSKKPETSGVNRTPPLTPLLANAAPTIVATSLVVSTPPVISPPPIVAAPLVVTTPAIGNSTPGLCLFVVACVQYGNRKLIVGRE
ncbi:hypothetical protein BDD12DRAFT_933549 [Trichophaea hybrida]|nr:hypothetical protein BDD12DRAFT_933549 [Trichophaea hybrida]